MLDGMLIVVELSRSFDVDVEAFRECPHSLLPLLHGAEDIGVAPGQIFGCLLHPSGLVHLLVDVSILGLDQLVQPVHHCVARLHHRLHLLLQRCVLGHLQQLRPCFAVGLFQESVGL